MGEERQLVQESPGATPQKRPSGLFLAAPLFNTSHLPSLLSCQEPKEPCKTCACISIGEKEPSLQKAGRAASALALCIFLSNA